MSNCRRINVELTYYNRITNVLQSFTNVLLWQQTLFVAGTGKDGLMTKNLSEPGLDQIGQKTQPRGRINVKLKSD